VSGLEPTPAYPSVQGLAAATPDFGCLGNPPARSDNSEGKVWPSPVDLPREGNRVDTLNEHDCAREKTRILVDYPTPFLGRHLLERLFAEAGAR
jgi:hypothetical protein